MKKIVSIVLWMGCAILACKTPQIPLTDFSSHNVPEPPNYTKLDYWAFHPQRDSAQDLLPKKYNDSLFNNNPEVDVFFIHPTLYFDGSTWNADLQNTPLNKMVRDLAIRNQASVFSGIAQVYAPQYRQMHIHCYSDLPNGLQAFDVAYADVYQAFMTYWEKWNNGRPFILAGHSQGTNHAERLVKELILKNDSMRNQLQLVYLPGMPIIPFSDKLPPCTAPTELACFLSWRTYAEHYYPPHLMGDSIASINPITWQADTLPSAAQDHLGILFQNNKIHYEHSVIVYNHKGLLWMKEPYIPFARLYKRSNYHIADFNLYWLNIRQNLRARLAT